MTIEQRLQELGIRLPEASSPAASYTNTIAVGTLLFVASKTVWFRSS